MIGPKRKIFFDWMTGGIAAVSLGFILFIPKVEIASESLKWAIEALFFITLPLAVAATAISKEADVFEESLQEEVKGIYAVLLLSSLTTFFVAFCLLSFGLKWYLSLFFLFSAALSISAYRLAQRKILKSYQYKIKLEMAGDEAKKK